ncbi:unnamed protein product [Periconia digitata]|uniref:NmrA-like domain-containing protein n=1 Tax=Periconia digitata TaxID=1303443 RepID=A0A9W4UL69_9PLEO|nr:unnamed protein product [Periconia digitata]
MATLHVLVVGATGKQGHATIAALEASARQTPPVRILALTRSSKSIQAQNLISEFPEIDIVEGNVSQPEPIFDAYPNITSIFLVTVPPNDEQQALPMINAAISRNIPHIVFGSVDRGGDTLSWTNETTVPHFAAKHRIELHLRAATKGTRTNWTILRPAGFMDNYTPGFFGKMMAGLWATMPPDRKMQLVSVKDIGVVAAKALLDVNGWKEKSIGIAGDELTFGEADAIFHNILGYSMPRIWSMPSHALRWGVEDARSSMDWFEKVGFGVDIQALREQGFETQNFEQWLRSSGHISPQTT